MCLATLPGWTGMMEKLEVYQEALQDTQNQLENAKVELETMFVKEARAS